MSKGPIVLTHLAPPRKDSRLPEYNAEATCTKHPGVPSMTGFGMAGGGYGPYTVCRKCGLVLTKTDTGRDDEPYRAPDGST